LLNLIEKQFLDLNDKKKNHLALHLSTRNFCKI
jgi:hypothetical protein